MNKYFENYIKECSELLLEVFSKNISKAELTAFREEVQQENLSVVEVMLCKSIDAVLDVINDQLGDMVIYEILGISQFKIKNTIKKYITEEKIIEMFNKIESRGEYE